MSIRDKLLDDLCATRSEDWKLRNVLADWFEDNHNPEEAACLRWMLENHKRPYHGSLPSATWFNADTVSPSLGDPESDIPGSLYDQLAGGKQTANHKTFETLRAAEEAFIAAWLAARKAGWKPAR